MAVADTLQELATDLTNAYSVLNTKGGVMPEHKNTNNLAETIQSLNVGSITTEVVKKTLTAEATGITFNTTSGQIPKAIELWNENEGTAMQSGEIRKLFFIGQAGSIYRNNRVNRQNAWFACTLSGDNVSICNITLTNSSVSIGHTSNTYYLANVEYKLIAYYWEDSQKLPTLTATSNMTTSQQVYNFLKQYAENDAYTIFTRGDGIDFRTLSDDSFGFYAILKTNNTPSGISAVTWKNNALRIIPFPESAAYALKLNEGEKVYRTVIPLDGRVYRDTSDIDNLIAGTMPNVEFESVKSIGANFFQNNQTIKSVSFPNSTNTGATAFYDCKQLESIYFPKATYVSGYSFRNCVKLKNVKLESVTTLGDYCFQGCTGLETMNLPKCTSISLTAFVGGLSKFDTLVLGSDTVCALAGIGAFVNTPFRNGTGGTVYVPNSLVSSYESATNWRSLESTTFAAIEDNIATLEALGLNVDEFKE